MADQTAIVPAMPPGVMQPSSDPDMSAVYAAAQAQLTNEAVAGGLLPEQANAQYQQQQVQQQQQQQQFMGGGMTGVMPPPPPNFQQGQQGKGGCGGMQMMQSMQGMMQMQAGQGMGQETQDTIYIAAGTALGPIAHLEEQWDFEKLKWKITGYFRSAAKDFEFLGTWEKCINDYADSAFGTLTYALKDRAWLRQADFTLILDEAVKALFPRQLFTGVEEWELEAAILKANDRSFEESRVLPMLWDLICTRIDQKKKAQKVYKAMESARVAANETIQPQNYGLESTDASPSARAHTFVRIWIGSTIKQLSSAGYDLNEDIFPAADMNVLFQDLLQADMLPTALQLELGAPLPAPWPYAEQCVTDAYQAAAPVYTKPQWVDMPKKKARFTPDPRTLPNYKAELCWYHENGGCSFGNECKNAHGEMELRSNNMWGCGGGCFGGFGGKGGFDGKGGFNGKGSFGGGVTPPSGSVVAPPQRTFSENPQIVRPRPRVPTPYGSWTE